MIATCGHEVIDSISIKIKGTTRDHKPCIDYVGYCSGCVREAYKARILLSSEMVKFNQRIDALEAEVIKEKKRNKVADEIIDELKSESFINERFVLKKENEVLEFGNSEKSAHIKKLQAIIDDMKNVIIYFSKESNFSDTQKYCRGAKARALQDKYPEIFKQLLPETE